MKKALIRIVLFAMLGSGGYVAYMFSTTKRHSPFEHAYYKSDSLRIDIDYCRPYQKGRILFGYEPSGAIQPYGEYWRLGANEATTIEISRDVSFGDRILPAGKYSIYAYPNEETFEIVVNKEWDRWGFFKPNKDLDVISVTVPVEKKDKRKEQFTIEFTKFYRGARIDFDWGNTHFHVPVSY